MAEEETAYRRPAEVRLPCPPDTPWSMNNIPSQRWTDAQITESLRRKTPRDSRRWLCAWVWPEQYYRLRAQLEEAGWARHCPKIGHYFWHLLRYRLTKEHRWMHALDPREAKKVKQYCQRTRRALPGGLVTTARRDHKGSKRR